MAYMIREWLWVDELFAIGGLIMLVLLGITLAIIPSVWAPLIALLLLWIGTFVGLFLFVRHKRSARSE